MDPIKGIVQFNQDRRLSTFDAMAEYNMLVEELQEFLVAASLQDQHETVDALCDMIVLSVGAIYKLGYDPTATLQETVKEITSRKGGFNQDTGKWEKDKTQDPATLYKAAYELARR